MKFNDQKRDMKKLKDELDTLEDAEQVIEESFGEGLKLFLGESMVDIDEDRATKYHQKCVEEKQNQIEKLGDEIEETENELKNLKSFLYARFGTSINLEEE